MQSFIQKQAVRDVMKLYMPTLVYNEPGCVVAHGKEICALGTKAMIVTGKHSSRINGSFQDVIHILERENMPYVVYDDIEENPSVETATKAAKMAVEEKVDFFVAVGGGSPMDASKAISLLAKNPEYIENAQTFFYGGPKLDWYPIVAIPTTSGTGSEVTPYSILTLHDSHTKASIGHRIFPNIALVDAGYLRTASYAGMVSTCVDALAHLVESYLNTNATFYSRLYAKEGLQIWGRVKDKLADENAFAQMTGEDYSLFMQASVMGGIAIAHTGTSLPHGLSYPVTYELHVPHGKAVGMFLPAFLKNYADMDGVNTVLNLLGFDGIESFEQYMKMILGPVIIPEALWERNVERLLNAPAKMANYPFEMTAEILKSFY